MPLISLFLGSAKNFSCTVIIPKPGQRFSSCENRFGNAKLLSRAKVLDEGTMETLKVRSWDPCASTSFGVFVKEVASQLP